VTGKLKFATALAMVYALFLGLLAFCAAALWSALDEREQALIAQIAAQRAGLIAVLALIVLVALGIAMHALYRRYVVTPGLLAEEARIILAGNPAHRLTPAGPLPLHELARSVNELADRAAERQAAVDTRIAAATAKLDEERNRLAALMSELSLCVLVCNSEGRILLYNSRAQALLGRREAGLSLIGLGRSVFSVLERNQVAHAQARIEERLAQGEANPVANFVTATPAGRLVRVQMAPVRDAKGGQSGFVLTLDDITAQVESQVRRATLLQALTEGSRPALAGIRAAVEAMSEFPEMDPAQRNVFVAIISEESSRLSTRLEQSVAQYGEDLAAPWPLEEMQGRDVVQLAQRQIGTRVGLDSGGDPVVDPAIWLKLDSYWLTLALTSLAQRLRDEHDVHAVRLRLTHGGRLAYLDLLWPGAPLPVDVIRRWEAEPLRVGEETSPLTLRQVIERHGGEAWYQHDGTDGSGCYRLAIPAASAVAPSTAPAAPSRPEYYDFDLFHQPGQSAELDERLLADIDYTAFDTETTGLDPSGGDEIISLGAVRIVNGRLLPREVFDQLVDPQRSIAPESIAVHGIDPSMLLGQPTIAQALPPFAQFCEGTVLVAHNAAFDMRFLQLKEAQTGVRFAQPVLDTLLLSALLHPGQAEHGLEAVAARLGVSVIGRHSALGDALLTGEIFLKMLPLLAAQGIRTLRQAREAGQKTYYARIAY
jgi:DNA polymerase-3 subunit epsilon